MDACNIQDEEIPKLIEVLQKNESIKSFTISIQEKGLNSIISLLHSGHKLARLDFSRQHAHKDSIIHQIYKCSLIGYSI
jgi:hypothetical protein